jgi:hypothetical protein
MAKPYATLQLDEQQFLSLRGAACETRKTVFKAWSDATDPNEKAFYRERVAVWDNMIQLFDDRLIADTSQDAPDEEEGEG